MNCLKPMRGKQPMLRSLNYSHPDFTRSPDLWSVNEPIDFIAITRRATPDISKMHLTKSTTPTTMTAPRSIEVGICNPRIHGDNTPIIKSVFLCLPFLSIDKFINREIHIMTVLFEQPFRLVAPCSDIANSLNTVTRLFAKSCDGFTHSLHGIRYEN
jgi:hypothetical protein